MAFLINAHKDGITTLTNQLQVQCTRPLPLSPLRDSGSKTTSVLIVCFSCMYTQDTDSEKYSSHVEAISSQMEGFARLVHEVKLIKSAVREVEGCITSHNTDEVHDFA